MCSCQLFCNAAKDQNVAATTLTSALSESPKRTSPQPSISERYHSSQSPWAAPSAKTALARLTGPNDARHRACGRLSGGDNGGPQEALEQIVYMISVSPDESIPPVTESSGDFTSVDLDWNFLHRCFPAETLFPGQ